jgi:nitrogen-specific signal transduction histidine kinase
VVLAETPNFSHGTGHRPKVTVALQTTNNEWEMMNRILIQSAKDSAKTERELNDFIAHEVRNPLSAAMSAASFISSTVNEREPLKTVEDQGAV